MTQKEHYPIQTSDEISLVDLAKTFVKRRRVFYIVFLFCVSLGLVYSFFADNKYRFQSLIQVAQDVEGDALESPKSIIAILENRWVPGFKAMIHAESEVGLPFELSFTTPEDTALVSITTETTAQNAELVKRAHGVMLEQIMQRQTQLVRQKENGLKRQLASVDETINMLRGVADSGPAIASAVGSKSELENQLEGIVAPEVLVDSRQGSDSTGPSKPLILALAALLGLVAGVFMAFFSEFVSLVREQLQEGDA